MIIVDGQVSDSKISSFSNLEELLAEVMRADAMKDRVVTDVLVNNETFSEIYPHQAEDMSCENIESVELRTMPAAEMATEMAAEMGKVARMMDSGARNVSRLFREASDTDALELFQDLLDVTRDFMDMLNALRSRLGGKVEPDYEERVTRMSGLLSEMSDIMENEDWILLSDLLEYEFAPICLEWQAASEKLHDALQAVAA